MTVSHFYALCSKTERFKRNLCNNEIPMSSAEGLWGGYAMTVSRFGKFCDSPLARGSNNVKLWCGFGWCSVVWCGVVWCGVVWCSVVWWCGVVWCGGVGDEVVWYDMVWCSVVLCGVMWC